MRANILNPIWFRLKGRASYCSGDKMFPSTSSESRCYDELDAKLEPSYDKASQRLDEMSEYTVSEGHSYDNS